MNSALVRASLGRASPGLIGVLLPLLVGSAAYGWEWPDDADRALPCRPTIACTADIVPPGTSEIEAGLIGRSFGGNGGQVATPFLAKLTVEKWLQLQLGGNGYTFTHGNVNGQYLDDLTVGAKFHLLDQDETFPSVAFSATGSIPVSRDQAAFKRTYDALFTAYATRDFGPIHADLNLGLNIWRIDAAPLPQQWLALAVSTDVSGKWTAMAEGYYFTDAAPISLKDGGLLAAMAYSPHPWIVLDAGADLGFFRTIRSYSLFAGITVIPGVLWRPNSMRSPSP